MTEEKNEVLNEIEAILSEKVKETLANKLTEEKSLLIKRLVESILTKGGNWSSRTYLSEEIEQMIKDIAKIHIEKMIEDKKDILKNAIESKLNDKFFEKLADKISISFTEGLEISLIIKETSD